MEELLAAGKELSPPVCAADISLQPWGCFGYVLLRRPAWTAAAVGNARDDLVDGALQRLLLGLRSVHDVLWHFMMLPLPSAADNPPLALYESLRAMPVDSGSNGGGGPMPPLLGGSRTFRVSCVREGNDHEFTSLDIEREVGGALHELYGAAADLKDFDLRCRCDVAHEVVMLGVALNRAAPLSKRHKLAFTRSVTLKPNVAYALLHLAKCQHGSVVLDPCCGSGTIPLEAASVFARIEAHGVDKSGAVIKGAKSNAKAASLVHACTFREGNCRRLDDMYEAGQFDCVVTNAPWGLQTAKGGGSALLEKIYRGLLLSSHKVCKRGACFVCLVLRWSLLLDLARRTGLWQVEALVPVRTSALSPVAVVMRRLDEDALKSGVVSTLGAFTKYFGEPKQAALVEVASAAADGAEELAEGQPLSDDGDGGGEEEEEEAHKLNTPRDGPKPRGGARGGRGQQQQRQAAPPTAVVPSFVESAFCTRREYEASLRMPRAQRERAEREASARRERAALAL